MIGQQVIYTVNCVQNVKKQQWEKYSIKKYDKLSIIFINIFYLLFLTVLTRFIQLAGNKQNKKKTPPKKWLIDAPWLLSLYATEFQLGHS